MYQRPCIFQLRLHTSNVHNCWSSFTRNQLSGSISSMSQTCSGKRGSTSSFLFRIFDLRRPAFYVFFILFIWYFSFIILINENTLLSYVAQPKSVVNFCLISYFILEVHSFSFERILKAYYVYVLIKKNIGKMKTHGYFIQLYFFWIKNINNFFYNITLLAKTVFFSSLLILLHNI